MKLENIKAIIFDIDSTAIPNGRWTHPTKEVVSACKKATKVGLILAPATGRNYKFCKYILEELNITSKSIVAAGTQIIDPKNGNEVWSTSLTETSVGYALNLLKPFDCKILIDDDTPEEALTVGLIKISKYRLLDVQDIPNNKIDALIVNLKKHANLSVVKVSSVNTGFSNLHITHKKATKEHAINVWLKLYNLTKSEVAGVGDGSNDLELFKSVGFKVAMGNAVPELKLAANIVIDSVENNGFATFVTQVVDSKTKTRHHAPGL